VYTTDKSTAAQQLFHVDQAIAHCKRFFSHTHGWGVGQACFYEAALKLAALTGHCRQVWHVQHCCTQA
jgi:hypothetical protein